VAAAISYEQSDPSYRADPAHAQSNVKHILKSPAHYLAAKQRKFSPTLTMQIGSAIHCLALEGKEQFEKDFILKPDGLSLTTKEGKEWKASAGKKTVLSKTDQFASWDAVHGMTESLQRLQWFNPDQQDYRKYNELSLYWNADGLDCKCRLDRLVLEEDRAIILDLKSTDNVDSKEFTRKVIGDLNYLFQSAWYVEGVEAAFSVPGTFVFVGIERLAPYRIKVFEVDFDAILEGKAQTKLARQRLAECLKTKEWSQPEIEYETLSLPPWFASPTGSAILEESLDPLLSAFEVA